MPKTLKTYRIPRAPTKVASIILSDETKEKLDIPDYLLNLKASEWADITNTVKNCFSHEKSILFTFDKLYTTHLDAFNNLTKQSTFKECTVGLQQYSAKVYKYYSTTDAKKDFLEVFNEEDRKRRKERSYANTQDEIEIATNKMLSKEAKMRGQMTEDERDSDIPNSQESAKTSTSEESSSSILTTNYHPLRTLNYDLVESSVSGDGTESCDEDGVTWIVDGFDILYALKNFRAISQQIPPANLSDLRLLAINHIYLFTLNPDNSVTRYFDVYDNNDLSGDIAELKLKKTNDDLNKLEGKVNLPQTVNIWINKLLQECTLSTNWYDMQRLTVPFLTEAIKLDDNVLMIFSTIIYKITLNMSNRTPNIKLEDSYVHAIISIILESVFQPDPIWSYQWANGYLNESSIYKPDFLLFVNHSKERYNLLISEVKPPSNANGNATESDMVKLGKQMAWMLNMLIRQGVSHPVVGGILLEGFKMTTYKMDLQYPRTYRMIELASHNLFDNLQDISTLPSIISSVIQIKNIVKKTAIKAKKVALEKAEGVRPEYSPSLSFTSQSQYGLRPVRSKGKGKSPRK
ncbi:unnamed protein product [Mucor hiemalis]